jgi:hypothetical protein
VPAHDRKQLALARRALGADLAEAALTTTTARTPRRPQASTAAATCGAGTTMIARSGASGSAATSG